jgi:hypothetical protein
MKTLEELKQEYKFGCACAHISEEGEKYCYVSGDRCMFMIPNAYACAERFGEGPCADEYFGIVNSNKEE